MTEAAHNVFVDSVPLVRMRINGEVCVVPRELEQTITRLIRDRDTLRTKLERVRSKRLRWIGVASMEGSFSRELRR